MLKKRFSASGRVSDAGYIVRERPTTGRRIIAAQSIAVERVSPVGRIFGATIVAVEGAVSGRRVQAAVVLSNGNTACGAQSLYRPKSIVKEGLETSRGIAPATQIVIERLES